MADAEIPEEAIARLKRDPIPQAGNVAGALPAHHIAATHLPHMTLVDFIVLLFVAGLAGSVGQAIGGYSHGGCLVSIALGFIGALIGAWMARKAGLPDPLVIHISGTSFPVIWSILGSALFVALLGLASRIRR